jgi:hypothetical protein
LVDAVDQQIKAVRPLAREANAEQLEWYWECEFLSGTKIPARLGCLELSQDLSNLTTVFVN